MSRLFHHWIGGAVVAVLVVVGATGLGRTAQALTLVPPSLEFGTAAGQTLRTSIKLYNEGADAVVLYTSTANFTAKDEAGTPTFDFNPPDQDLAAWIKTDPTQLTLAPGDRREVAVAITVPANADPGGHYAAVFFGTQPLAIKGGQIGVASKVGTLVILRVEGAVREFATVKEFSIIGGTSTFAHPPVSFNLRIANEGNVHLRPSGTVDIKNMFGGQTASLVLNPAQGAVLPDSTRRFQIDWKKDAGGRTGFFNQVGTEWRNFGLGTYTAQANIIYGTPGQTLIATTTFTLFPWHLLLVELVVVAALIFLIVFGVGRYNAMIIRHAESQRSSPSGS